MSAPVTFVHLPKTAGTTVHTVIRARCPGALFGVRQEWKHWFAHPDEIPDAPAYLGHMPYGLHALLDRELTYLTMLRHPVARAVSHYHYLRQSPQDRSHQRAAGPIEDWAQDCDMNLMTLQLAGRRQGDPWLARRQDDALLGRALDNAATFTVIGFQERFDESLALMSARLGWGLPRYRSRRVLQSYPRPSEAAAAIITERNQLDLELYRVLAARMDADLRGVRTRTFALRALNAPRRRTAP